MRPRAAIAQEDKPDWLIVRERQQGHKAHEELTEKDSRRGTNRNMYLLNDRVFFASPPQTIKGIVGYIHGPTAIDPVPHWANPKPAGVTVMTRKGVRNMGRQDHKYHTEMIHESKRYKKRHDTAKRRRKAKQQVRKRQRCSK